MPSGSWWIHPTLNKGHHFSLTYNLYTLPSHLRLHCPQPRAASELARPASGGSPAAPKAQWGRFPPKLCYAGTVVLGSAWHRGEGAGAGNALSGRDRWHTGDARDEDEEALYRYL